MYQQSSCKSNRDGFRLACDSTTFYKRKHIVLVQATCTPKSPQGTLTVVKPGKNIHNAPPVDHNLALAFNKPDLRRRRLPPSHAARTTHLVDRDGRRLLLVRITRSQVHLHRVEHLLGHDFPVDTVQPEQDLDDLLVPGRGHRFSDKISELHELEPGHSRGFCRVDGREHGIFGQEVLQTKQLIRVVRGAGKVCGRGGDDSGRDDARLGEVDWRSGGNRGLRGTAGETAPLGGLRGQESGNAAALLMPLRYLGQLAELDAAKGADDGLGCLPGHG